jgi:hypothetical protein
MGAQFLDPIVMQVLSTAKSCLSRLSLVCQSNLPPSLQALGEMLLNNTNENVFFLIASARRMATISSGLVIGVHGVTIQNSGIKKKKFRLRSNLDRLASQPIQIRPKKTKRGHVHYLDSLNLDFGNKKIAKKIIIMQKTNYGSHPVCHSFDGW